MIRLIIYSILGLGLATAAVWIADQGGSLTFNWQDWQIQTSVGVALVLLFVAALVLYMVWRLVALILHPPILSSQKRREGRQQKGLVALDRGFNALAAGNPTTAAEEARKAQRYLGGNTAAYLLEAQANRQLPAARQNQGRQAVLYKKLVDQSETKLIGLRGQIEAAVAESQWHKALPLAQDAVDAAPKSPWALQALLDLQIRVEDWDNALATLKKAAKLNILPTSRLSRMRAILNYCQAREEKLAGHRSAALKRVELALKDSPELLPAVLLAVELAPEDESHARKLLEAAWRREPHPHLADAYLGLRSMETPTEQLRRGERLARTNPDHLESHHLLARLNLDTQHWPAVRQHLDPLLQSQRATAQTYELLAELEELQKNDDTAAAALRRQGEKAPKGASWTCDHCGQTTPAWAPHCPQCSTFDSLHWASPTNGLRIQNIPATPTADLLLPS